MSGMIKQSEYVTDVDEYDDSARHRIEPQDDELGALARAAFNPAEIIATGEWDEFTHHHPDEADAWRRVGRALYDCGYHDALINYDPEDS